MSRFETIVGKRSKYCKIKPIFKQFQELWNNVLINLGSVPTTVGLASILSMFFSSTRKTNLGNCLSPKKIDCFFAKHRLKGKR